MKERGYALIPVLILGLLMAVLVLTLQDSLLSYERMTATYAVNEWINEHDQFPVLKYNSLKMNAHSYQFSNTQLFTQAIPWKNISSIQKLDKRLFIQHIGRRQVDSRPWVYWDIYQVNLGMGSVRYPLVFIRQQWRWYLIDSGKVSAKKFSKISRIR